MRPSVAVVVPTRDRGELLVEALRSVVAATPAPDEVVIADGGSADGSVERAAALDPRIRVVRGDYRNASATRNAGVAATRAEVIAFLDSDDSMEPTKLGALVPLLDDETVVLAHGRTVVVDAGGAVDVEASAAHRRLFDRAAGVGTTYEHLAGFCAMFTSATIVRRSAFEQVGGYDESLDVFEDWDLYLRLSLVGRLIYSEREVARYRVWPGNIAWERTAAGIARVAEKHLRALPPLPAAAERLARLGFQARLAETHHVLLDRKASRRAALSAVRLAPVAALRRPSVRRPLLLAPVPTAVLRRRRAAPSPK